MESPFFGVYTAMGYTLTVRSRNAALRDSMLALLGEQYTPWDPAKPRICPVVATGPRALTWHYGAGLCGWAHEQVYTIMRWVALSIGRTKRRFSKEVLKGLNSGLLEDPLPFITYDDYQSWPCLKTTPEAFKSVPKPFLPWACSPLGIPLDSTQLAFIAFLSLSRKEMNADLKNMMVGTTHEERKARQLAHLEPFIQKGVEQLTRKMQDLDNHWKNRCKGPSC